jgi:ArsR family transcriptional regulator, arsenate/arsenite/antimonite-responsive transcriptional repressor
MSSPSESACSCSPSNKSRDVPEQVESDLVLLGGIPGLCSRIPPDETIIRVISVHQALSDPVRLKILHLVDIRPLCVSVIRACLGISDSKLSYHLCILKKVGFIEGNQKGNWIIYSLTSKGSSYLGNRTRENYPSYYTLAD